MHSHEMHFDASPTSHAAWSCCAASRRSNPRLIWNPSQLVRISHISVDALKPTEHHVEGPPEQAGICSSVCGKAWLPSMMHGASACVHGANQVAPASAQRRPRHRPRGRRAAPQRAPCRRRPAPAPQTSRPPGRPSYSAQPARADGGSHPGFSVRAWLQARS